MLNKGISPRDGRISSSKSSLVPSAIYMHMLPAINLVSKKNTYPSANMGEPLK
jgi:hypothetical protein